MQKSNRPTPQLPANLLQTAGIYLIVFGLFLVLASILLGIVVLSTNLAAHTTWTVTSAATGVWFIWVGLTLRDHLSPFVAAVRYTALSSMLLFGCFYLADPDIRYFYAGTSLVCCTLLVEQATAIHKEFATYYRGLRFLTVLGSWTMSIVALGFTIIYIVPLTDALAFVSQLGEKAPSVVLFAGYGFLSMLKKGMTPHTPYSA